MNKVIWIWMFCIVAGAGDLFGHSYVTGSHLFLSSFQEDTTRFPTILPEPFVRIDSPARFDNLSANFKGFLPKYIGDHTALYLLDTWVSEPTIEEARDTLLAVLHALSFDSVETRSTFTFLAKDSLNALADSIAAADSNDVIDRIVSTAIDRINNTNNGHLSHDNEENIRRVATRLRKQALNRPIRYRFQQGFKLQGQIIPIDGVVMTVSWRASDRPITVSGRFYSVVNVTNRLAPITLGDVQPIVLGSLFQDIPFDPIRETNSEIVILPYGEGFRFALKLDFGLSEGQFLVWVDADSREILKTQPVLYSSDNAKGTVSNPDPTSPALFEFEIDPPVLADQHSLVLNRVPDDNDDFVGVFDAFHASSSQLCNLIQAVPTGALVNFDAVATADPEKCSTSELNGYYWSYVFNTLYEGQYGIDIDRPIKIFVNRASTTCGSSPNQACFVSLFNALQFGRGSRTSPTAPCPRDANPSDNSALNSVDDATVIAHEFGHLINCELTNCFFSAVLPPYTEEGLADFWSHLYFNTDVMGAYWYYGCPPVQDGTGRPPRQSDAMDVFPDVIPSPSPAGRYVISQILGWSLWNAKLEFEQELSGDFEYAKTQLYTNLPPAIHVPVSGTGLFNHYDISEAYTEIVELFANEYLGALAYDWRVHKIFSSFARAGLFVSDKVALIDSDVDIISESAAMGPTFEVWLGADYCFNGSNAVPRPDATLPDCPENEPTGESVTIMFSPDPTFPIANRLPQVVNLSSFSQTAGMRATNIQMEPSIWSSYKNNDVIYYMVDYEDDGCDYSSINIRTCPSLVNVDVDPPYVTVVEDETGGGLFENCFDSVFSFLYCLICILIILILLAWIGRTIYVRMNRSRVNPSNNQ